MEGHRKKDGFYPRIVQLVVFHDSLYALDAGGRVYLLDEVPIKTDGFVRRPVEVLEWSE